MPSAPGRFFARRLFCQMNQWSVKSKIRVQDITLRVMLPIIAILKLDFEKLLVCRQHLTSTSRSKSPLISRSSGVEPEVILLYLVSDARRQILTERFRLAFGTGI